MSSRNSSDYKRKRTPSRSPCYRRKRHNSDYKSDDTDHSGRNSESSEDVDRKRRSRSPRARKFEDKRSEQEKNSRQMANLGKFSREDSSESDSNKNTVSGTSDSRIIGYKIQLFNNITLIQYLPQHITENDIRNDIIHSGLMAKDIQLIRRQDTGTSMGFAFVVFKTLQDAERWMRMKLSDLILPNEQLGHKAWSDWFCKKCGGQSRQDQCYKCNSSRVDGGYGYDEISNYITKTIMLRNLDALTTENTVMAVLTIVIPELVKTISAVCIGRDEFTATSTRICYLGTENLLDALAVYGALSNLPTPLSIDGETILLSYCKYYMGDKRKAYHQANEAAFPNAAAPSTHMSIPNGTVKNPTPNIIKFNFDHPTTLENPQQTTTTPQTENNKPQNHESNNGPCTDKETHLDYVKLTCNLCWRQFKTAVTLKKHSKSSQLHKDNLKAKNNGTDNIVNNDRKLLYQHKSKVENDTKKITYRDRPKKHRYGVDQLDRPIGPDNAGNKLLKKMGWKEGQGLGKSNQGRITIIHIEHKLGRAGLGKNEYA